MQDILDPGLVLQQFNSLDGSIEDLVSTLSQLVQELSLSPDKDVNPRFRISACLLMLVGLDMNVLPCVRYFRLAFCSNRESNLFSIGASNENC